MYFVVVVVGIVIVVIVSIVAIIIIIVIIGVSLVVLLKEGYESLLREPKTTSEVDLLQLWT